MEATLFLCVWSYSMRFALTVLLTTFSNWGDFSTIWTIFFVLPKLCWHCHGKNPHFWAFLKPTLFLYFTALQLCSVSDQINQVKVLEEVGSQWYKGKASRKHRRMGMAKGWAAPAAAPLLPSECFMSSLEALPDFCISETPQCSCL